MQGRGGQCWLPSCGRRSPPRGAWSKRARAQRAFCRAQARGSTDRGRRPTLRKIPGSRGKLSGLRKRRLRFLRSEPFRPHDRVGQRRLKVEPVLSLRDRRLHFVIFPERREQRLRLGDLGHFRRRRKAFERRREDGVSFDGAAGRLIELRERQRRSQAPAAGALLLRYGDCRPRMLPRREPDRHGSRLSRSSPRRR